MTNKKVLVVDDEIHIVHVVSLKLRNRGFEVISADNGADAYDRVCEETPDLIITDFQMPVMTGLEFLEKLRGNRETAAIPVIMLTARSHAISTEQMETLRIHTCLSKPFSPRELLSKVEDILFQVQVSIGLLNEA